LIGYGEPIHIVVEMGTTAVYLKKERCCNYQMNMGFNIGRMSYVAHFGPLIDYFRKKGVKISLLCDHRQKQKDHRYKAYLYPDLEKIKSVFSDIEVRTYHSIKECVMGSTLSVCLGPTRKDDWAGYAEIFALKDLSLESGNYYNFDGVVYNESVDNFSAEFSQKGFGDYGLDMQNRKRFMEEFLGYSGMKSYKRVYDHLSNMIVMRGSLNKSQIK